MALKASWGNILQTSHPRRELISPKSVDVTPTVLIGVATGVCCDAVSVGAPRSLERNITGMLIIKFKRQSCCCPRNSPLRT